MRGLTHSGHSETRAGSFAGPFGLCSWTVGTTTGRGFPCEAQVGFRLRTLFPGRNSSWISVSRRAHFAGRCCSARGLLTAEGKARWKECKRLCQVVLENIPNLEDSASLHTLGFLYCLAGSAASQKSEGMSSAVRIRAFRPQASCDRQPSGCAHAALVPGGDFKPLLATLIRLSSLPNHNLDP